MDRGKTYEADGEGLIGPTTRNTGYAKASYEQARLTAKSRQNTGKGGSSFFKRFFSKTRKNRSKSRKSKKGKGKKRSPTRRY